MTIIKIGSVVERRGVRMTVESVAHEHSISGYSAMVGCVWFDSEDQLRRGKFPASELQLVSE